MFKILHKIDNLIDPLRKTARLFLSPLLDLAIRLYMADIFFKSGYLKLESYLNDNWSSTVFLFEEVHPLPYVSLDLAAIAGTAGEIILPVLLALGLFGRLGAGGLLIMTAVIEFGVPAEYGISNAQHYLWMLLLAVPLIKGPGILSLDALIRKFILRRTI